LSSNLCTSDLVPGRIVVSTSLNSGELGRFGSKKPTRFYYAIMASVVDSSQSGSRLSASFRMLNGEFLRDEQKELLLSASSGFRVLLV